MKNVNMKIVVHETIETETRKRIRVNRRPLSLYQTLISAENVWNVQETRTWTGKYYYPTYNNRHYSAVILLICDVLKGVQ